MAQTIKIKRSSSSAAPSSLGAGELAYSSNSKKLFVGHPSTSAVTTIGGDLYVQMLDHTAGTLTAASAIVVDSSSKIDVLKSGNIVVTGSSNTISTSSGNLTLAPTGNLVITHGGTIDLTGQANSLTLLDNNAAALDINEGGTSYLKFVTTNGSESTTVGSALSINLNTNTDVTITTPSSGQILEYNGSVWTNVTNSSIGLTDLSIGTNASASCSGGLSYNNSTGEYTFDFIFGPSTSSPPPDGNNCPF